MNPCLVAPATERPKRILSPVFLPVRTTHRRQGGALSARRYAKDIVVWAFMSRTPLRSSFSTSPVIELSWL